MVAMRLAGDKLVARLTGKMVVVGGSLIGAVGLSIAVLSPWILGAMVGFVLLGFIAQYFSLNIAFGFLALLLLLVALSYGVKGKAN